MRSKKKTVMKQLTRAACTEGTPLNKGGMCKLFLYPAQSVYFSASVA